MNKNIRKGNTALHLHLGQAGSGKSTSVYNMIKSGEIEAPLILCSRWILVRSIKDKLHTMGIECNVRTIQSITQRDLDFERNIGNAKTIIIEEFSQVDYTMLLSLVDKLERVGINEVYAIGDALQNSPVQRGPKTEYSPIRLILREMLLGKVSNFFSAITHLPIYETISIYDPNVPIPKDLQSIFSSIDIRVHTNNYRNNSESSLRSFTDIQNIITNTEPKSILQLSGDLVEYARMAEVQLIVADWRTMVTVNNMIEANHLADVPSNVYYDTRCIDDPFKQYRKYYTLRDDRFYEINGNDSMPVGESSRLYFRKTYAMVADSIQGMEFDYVALISILSNQKDKDQSWSNFSYNSIYTAATRHKKGIKLLFDELGQKDMLKAVNTLPVARMDKLSEEWYSYCINRAPESSIAWKEYERDAHFYIEDNKLYSIIHSGGFERGSEISLHHKVTSPEIKKVTEFTFMKEWERKRQPDENSRKIISEVYSEWNGNTRKASPIKKGKVDKIIELHDFDEMKLDFKNLTQIGFKDKYNLQRRSFADYLKKHS